MFAKREHCLSPSLHTISLSCYSVVAEQVENSVILLTVERVMVAMANHSHVCHVTLWGSKVFAHAASSGEHVMVQKYCLVQKDGNIKVLIPCTQKP